VHARALGLSRSVTFQEFAGRSEVVQPSSYLQNLVPFFDRFPKEQILILFFDELREDATRFVHSVYRFLGVNQTFAPSCLGKKVLEARDVRVVGLSRLAYRIALFLRTKGFASLVGRIKRSPVFDSLLYRRRGQSLEIPLAVRQQLHARYRGDYRQLAQLIGRDLPESWYREQHS
jgi:hypothetical protein